MGLPRRLVDLILVSSLTMALVACSELSQATPPTPSPSAASLAPQDPREVGLRKDDLPSALVQCLNSGDINRYLQLLQQSGSPSYEVTANQWSSLRNRGAQAGSVSTFTTDPADCDARLGERKSPSATSFSVRFLGSSQATQAFQSGFLGLRPASGMTAPGLVQGAGTKLGPEAWTYDQTGQTPNVWVAYWVKQNFVLFLLTERLSPAAARKAATGMDGRVR
jgi:hypothetical protein